MTDQDHVREVKALDQMDLAGLKAKYQELFGEEPVTRNTKVLREQIKRRLHARDIERKKKERSARTSVGKPQTATARVARLTKMSLDELRQEYEAVLGKKSRSRNRKQLIKRIADALQRDAYTEKMSGGKSPTLTVKLERKKRGRSRRAAKPTKKTPESKRAQHRQPGQRDPRLPTPGTSIERVYKGRKLLVRVLADGFEYEGKPYRSLSALAKHITGQIINGYAFFRLVPRETKTK